MPRLILLDDGLACLGPLGDLRASFEQRSGVFSALGRCEHGFGLNAQLHLSEDDGALAHERTSRPLVDLEDDSAAIVVNGRLASGGREEMPALGDIQRDAHGAVALAHLEGDALRSILEHPVDASSPGTRISFRHPWDLLDGLGNRIAADSSLFESSHGLPEWVTKVGEHPCLIGPDVTIMPGVVFDATDGPIIVQRGARIRANAVLCGPCSIGPDCLISDRTLVKGATSLGPGCKVGGEVGSVIMQAHANKVHDGHLGDALVGEWVNIGAGTDNSNLLNTYGEVAMRLDSNGPMHKTGRIFMGCVLGDHVKLAIGTRIMTGTVLSTGTMYAASTPPKALVERFSWCTDAGERLYQWRKFESVLRTVFARRSLEPGEALLRRLKTLHDARASSVA
jgi:UDP-N-acetylglucosamine diphosphorylase/glucosamine-1-phosphate N-acetyltransferase